jgi:hypothetical protein
MRQAERWSFWRRVRAQRVQDHAGQADRKEARGIAELIDSRLGWFWSVHRKSMEPQETRATLTARKLVQKERLHLANLQSMRCAKTVSAASDTTGCSSF